ncbi:MAG: HD-GYP domain-containing protein [Gammaproteobacteria bacterium]
MLLLSEFRDGKGVVMKIQYSVDQLELGMYVAELDRPWIGTPFLFQGFLIENDEQLDQLRQLCKHVFVDDLKSSTDNLLQNKLHAAVRGSTITVIFEEWKGLDKLRRTIQSLEQKSNTIAVRLKTFVDGDATQKSEQLRDTRHAVAQLIDDVTADPKTGFWMRILSEQDEEISRHAVNTSVLAVGFAAELGWDVHLQEAVGQGAMFHDVGMAKVPARIRDKPAALSQIEFQLIKLHPGYAATRLEGNADIDSRIIEVVRHHHERLDGSGYPDGLSGDSIPDYVQLVSICDIYDSYTTDQAYRPKLMSSAALSRLTRRSAQHFDKTLVEKFIRWIGIYPLGSLVRLRNTSLAIVVSSDAAKRLRPVVLLVKGPDGKAILPRKTLNLEAVEQAGLGDEWSVQEIVDPLTVGIDVRSILLQELKLR